MKKYLSNSKSTNDHINILNWNMFQKLIHLTAPYFNNTLTIKALFSQCLLCSGKCQTTPLLCDICLHDLPTFKPHDNLLNNPKFSRDISHKYIDTLICLAPYQWPFSLWINQLKYQQHFELAKLLVTILTTHHKNTLAALLSNKQTLLINVPIHITRWQERGYNQSHLIAKTMNNVLTCTYNPNVVRRIKATEQQVGKSGIERRTNIKNAFALNNEVSTNIPKHIVIIDDVITTGTTVNELARLFKKAGVAKISVITIALAVKP